MDSLGSEDEGPGDGEDSENVLNASYVLSPYKGLANIVYSSQKPCEAGDVISTLQQRKQLRDAKCLT